MDAALATLWEKWLPTARWFQSKGLDFRVAGVTPMGPEVNDPDMLIRSELIDVDVTDAGITTRQHYHTVVGYLPPGTAAEGLIGQAELYGQLRDVVDACLCPSTRVAYARSQVGKTVQGPVEVLGFSSYTLLAAGDVVLKIVRRLPGGLQREADALTALSGTKLAPEPLWTATDDHGHPLVLAMKRLQAHDGYQAALDAARESRSFADEARALGAVLRKVHERFAAKFPISDTPRARVADQFDADLREAARIPQVAAIEAGLAPLLDVGTGPAIHIQRIHGDFHLQQAMLGADGWRVVDFEGVPVRDDPSALDSPLRDVAGLVRSLDYARAQAGCDAAWRDEAVAAFLEGYGTIADEALLRAYEVDRMAYEAVYETRNRPDWVHVPLAALEDAGRRADPRPEPTQPTQENTGMAHDEFGGLRAQDLEGFQQGGDTECWRRLGSHEVTLTDDERGEIHGVRFAVWAPNAKEVRVNGDFNWWTGNPMTRVPGTGVWATFIEGLGTGALYKFNILGADGQWHEKVDPIAQFAEQAPANSSIVYESKFVWGDDAWMKKRAESEPHREPMSIYEVHLGSWRKGKTYLDLSEELVEYVRWQGFTHVEFMPVAEHPFEPSWGYQVTNYFAPESRLGRPDEFRHLIDALHQAGIGVILDWVPGHFPKDEWALGRFDGTALYEHADPRQGEHKDWGTYIFNYGRNEVKSFLVSNALYWLQEFHIDGLRVDAVASMLYLDYSRAEGEWVPNKYGGRENLEAIDLLRYVNRHCYERVPGIVTVAEESTAFPGVTSPVDAGGLGFGFKWNMGWMNDSLKYLGLEPIYRQYHHHELTFAMTYAYSENYILPISHDEVVHSKGSMINKVPQDTWRQFATLRAFYAYQWAFPGKQLLFMGCEFGQRPEFNEAMSLEWWVSDLWGHHGLQRMIKDLNGIYTSHPALWELDSDPAGFRWINADDAGANTYSWLRYGLDGSQIAVCVNFSSEPWNLYKIGLPHAGAWREIFNSDSGVYDGSDAHGNLGQIIATGEEFNGFPASATVVVPPLGAVYFEYVGDDESHV